MCSTALTETIDYYVSRKTPVYVLLIGASKAFNRVSHITLFNTPIFNCITAFVVVVFPLQPSSSVNSGCPGPESSILVSSRWACPISSQVTDH